MREFAALDGRIRGIRMGQGRPVLALHGFLDNAMSFKPLAEELRDVELWAIDLPGHGLSSALPLGDGWTLMQWLPILGRLLDDLNWPKYEVLGHSLGGILAQMLSTLEPRIHTLLALDALGPVTETDSGNLDRLQRCYDQRHPANRRRYYSAPDGLWRARLRGRFPLTERSARLLAWRGVGYSAQGWFHRYDRRLRQESLWRMTEPQAREMLQRIGCPMHLALFEQSPISVSAEQLRERQRCVPELHCQTFPGGHHAHMESPEPIARWVEQSLGDR